MTVDQGVYMISFDRLFLKKEVAYFEMKFSMPAANKIAAMEPKYPKGKVYRVK